jgi:hypothetical protein
MSLSFGGIYKPAAGGGEDPGLAFVVSSSFSGASSVSLDNVFTSAYENYRVLLIASDVSGTGIHLRFRMRAASTDASGSNYYSAADWALSTASRNVDAGAGETSGRIVYVDNATSVAMGAFDVLRPAVADDTHVAGFGYRNDPASLVGSWPFGAMHAVDTAYDGITLFPDSGTISGTIFVYGYRSS